MQWSWAGSRTCRTWGWRTACTLGTGVRAAGHGVTTVEVLGPREGAGTRVSLYILLLCCAGLMALGALTGLTRLDLTGCVSVSDVGLLVLAHNLKHLATLELAWCLKITCAGEQGSYREVSRPPVFGTQCGISVHFSNCISDIPSTGTAMRLALAQVSRRWGHCACP